MIEYGGIHGSLIVSFGEINRALGKGKWGEIEKYVCHCVFYQRLVKKQCGKLSLCVFKRK